MPTYRGLSKSDPEPCWTFCIKHVSQHIDKSREGILLKPAVDIQGRGLVWIQDGIIKMQKLIKATNQKSKITRKKYNKDNNKYVCYNHKQCKYKLLHMGSENPLNEDRVREI